MESLPKEILVHIFSFYIESEGIQSLFGTVAKVCRSWESAVYSSRLFRNVDTDLSRDTLMRLYRADCFRMTEVLSLGGYGGELTWESNFELRKMVGTMPFIKSLDMSNCMNLKADVIRTISKKCPGLTKINLSNVSGDRNLPRVSLSKLVSSCGSNLRYLNLSGNKINFFNQLMSNISMYCPNLEELHMLRVNTVGAFPIELVQAGCPNLRILQLGSNIQFTQEVGAGNGFPKLEHFCYYATKCKGPTSREFHRLVVDSKRLKKLDLRGCKQITALDLFDIKAKRIEYLSLVRSIICDSSAISLVLVKWHRSLTTLELSGDADRYVDLHMRHSSYSWSNIQVLTFKYSHVTMETVASILKNIKKLKELNLEYCPYIPKSLQKMHKGWLGLKVLQERIKLYLNSFKHRK